MIGCGERDDLGDVEDDAHGADGHLQEPGAVVGKMCFS